MAISKNNLTTEQRKQILNTLKVRFEENKNRHKGIEWIKVELKLQANTEKLWPLYQMEISDGEPDVADYDKKKDEYIFYDCSAESPKGRRSICYDQEALNSRKEHKPVNSVIKMATEMGIEVLTEEQ